MSKLLIVGIDAADLNFIELGVKAGRLPTFKLFFEKGVVNKLRSTYPPASCPAWNVFASGKSPAKIGIPWFMTRKKNTFSFQPYIYSEISEGKAFWDYVNDAGKQIGVINVPSVFRAEKVNGFIVAGFFKPQDMALTFPRGLESELNSAFGSAYIVDFWDLKTSLSYRAGQKEERSRMEKRRFFSDKWLLNRAREVMLNRSDATLYLMKKYPEWDLLITTFTSLDRVFHRLLAPEMMHAQSLLMESYIILDDCIKKLITVAGKDTEVLIMSDHGMQPVKWQFNINTWLEKIGVLHLKKESLNLLKNPSRYLTRSIKKMLFPVIRSNVKMERLINVVRGKINLQRFFRDSINFDENLIDWEHTKAYGYGNYGEIYVGPFCEKQNLSSRARKETIEHICSEFKKLQFLWQVQSAEILRKEDIYAKGPHLDKMPDLVVKIDDFSCTTRNTLSDSCLFVRRRGGSHSPSGVLMAMGNKIKPNARISEARIEDIAPTVLHLMGVPVPEDMDGRIWDEIIKNCAPVKYQKSESIIYKKQENNACDEKRLMERLRHLGYLG